MVSSIPLAGVTWLRAAVVRQETDLSDVVADGLTARDWAVAGITFVCFLVVGRLLGTLARRVIQRTEPEGTIARLVGRIVRNLFAIVGLFYALSALQVQLGPLLGALGITGIAVAFAITAILENVFASVVLKTRRPIRIGDEISTNDQHGAVEEINFRTVVLRSFDGEKVVVPSADVTNGVIVNHTANDTRRSVLPVGVAYGTDLPTAQDTILRAVRSVDGVLDAPAPQAWVTTFGNSSIDFDVRFWHLPDIATTFRVRSGAAIAIKAAFDEGGIEIPFPQRVVTMVPPVDAADPSPGD